MRSSQSGEERKTINKYLLDNVALLYREVGCWECAQEPHPFHLSRNVACGVIKEECFKQKEQQVSFLGDRKHVRLEALKEVWCGGGFDEG